ncbi:MAG: OmpA family protein [Flavobacteriaceae bacterium]|nr:OmpA family protein [Flavobacteriaceae bacterium]
MKISFKSIIGLLAFGLFFSNQNAEAQIWEKLKKNAEDRVEKGIDDILDGEKKTEKEEQTNNDKKKSEKNSDSKEEIDPEKEPLEVYRNYKFIPGEKVIFYDDLKHEEVGEFPSRWDLLKGGAEIVTFNGEKVIMGVLKYNNLITPLFKNSGYLSDEFTIEYDIYVDDNNREEQYHSTYHIDFSESTVGGRSIYMNASKYGKFTGYVRDSKGKTFGFESVKVGENSWSHIAMSYYKGKFKLYINGTRVLNLPNFSITPNVFAIDIVGRKDDRYGINIRAAIKNIRIAHGGGQMYKRIMADGKYVTNGILFDSGKATIKPQSMGIFNKIVSIMNENPDWNFQIIGHTDNDGSSEKNLLLSQERSKSVKETLITLGIKAKRLTTLGKGETEPLNTNSTPEEKSNNRRVEFIKI